MPSLLTIHNPVDSKCACGTFSKGIEMPRKPIGPRLYLDPVRRQWIIRHYRRFIRTGCAFEDKQVALGQLHDYKVALGPMHSLPSVPRGTGYVYFMSAAHPEFPIKIGFTERLGSHRMIAIQTACPYPIVMLGNFPSTVQGERKIHHIFDHLRMKGEWFRRDEKLLSFIESVCPAVPQTT